MATNRSICGLSGRGFRVTNTSANIVTVKEGVVVQVDVDDQKTRTILSREKDNFVRVTDAGTFTVTLASPGVFSKTGHGFVAGDILVFTTTGALPTGLTAGTKYYVIATGLTANAFQVSATVGGSAVNTSVSQSGTHTVTPQSANIFGITQNGFRVHNYVTNLPVVVRYGVSPYGTAPGVVQVDLTSGGVRRVLKRNYGRYIATTSSTSVSVRGLQEQQNGFELQGAGGTATLTSDNTNVTAADTVTIGANTYTFKTALTEVKATAVLNSNGTEPADGDTVTVNNVTYRFKNTMAQANDVKRGGVSSDADLDALIKAINQTGLVGTDYFAGTVAPTGVTAGARTGTGATGTTTITATVPGTAANSFASTKTGSNLTFANGATFTGGVNPVLNEVKRDSSTADASLNNLIAAINGAAGAGSTYATGTVTNPDVTASANVSHVTTLTATPGGNQTVALSTTAAHLAFNVTSVTDTLVKIYKAVQATVNPGLAVVYTQLRRHFKSWIEV